MGTDTLQRKIDEAKALLSKESRGAIDSVNWKFIISGMSNKYNQNQLENLETETELLLCGLLNPEDYPKELVTRMQISKEEVGLLIGEMDKLIFKKIQENLEKRLVISEQKIKEKKSVTLPVLDSRFSGLPKEVQTAIAQSNWRETLYSLAPKYKLTIEQMGILEEITVKVMLNTIHSNSYENELASKITIPKEDISNLVKEINENIFKKIREEEEVITNYQLPITNENKTITDYQLPITNKDKIITNYQLPIKNETLEEEIPLPPYKSITNDQLPITNKEKINTDYKLPMTDEEEISKTEITKNNINEILKKIEPIKPVEQIISTTKIQTPVPNQNTPVSQQPTPSVRSIIEEKLMGSTVSDNTTTDYSNPKKNDPYREAV